MLVLNTVVDRFKGQLGIPFNCRRQVRQPLDIYELPIRDVSPHHAHDGRLCRRT